MKRLIKPFFLTTLVCLLLSGCALFRSKKEGSGGAGASAGTGAGTVVSSNGVVEGGVVSNGPIVATVTTSGGGTITTATSEGKVVVTATGANSMGGGVSDFSGTSSGSASSGHGPLKYIFILFAAAIVIWIVWAIVHSLRTREEPDDDDYYYQRSRHHRHRHPRHYRGHG